MKMWSEKTPSFFDRAGKQPWSCALNVPIRNLKRLAPSTPASIWPPERASDLDPALWLFQFENQIRMVRSQSFFDLSSWVGKQPSSCVLNVSIRGPNQHGWLVPSLPRSGFLSGQATLILCFECSNSRTQSEWLASPKPSSIWPTAWARNLDPALSTL